MTGDTTDLLTRLKRLLPAGWFGAEGASPVVEAMLAGPAWVFSQIYALWLFASLQTRLATMTGGWLDFAAADFFVHFRRFQAEGDASYARRVRLEVFRDRNTRHAIDHAIYDITGQHPAIFEAWRPGDCGGYGTPGLAYGAVGHYGSHTAPYEVIVTTPFPQNYGIPNRGGWGSLTGGYSVGNFSFVDDADVVGSGPSVRDVIDAVERVRAAGVTILIHFTGVSA